MIGVSWPGRDLKRWAAANGKCINKKIKILQKLTYLSAKRGFFYASSSTSRHGPLISQKNFANWNDRNYTSFLPSHELEVTFEQTNTCKLPTLFIFPPTIQRYHNWYLYFKYFEFGFYFILSYLFIYLIYLSYTFIYLFIYYFPPSVSRLLYIMLAFFWSF